HLENARILTLLGRSDLPVFREYFAVNARPTPNWLGHLILAGLMTVFSPFVAEKILVSCYIVATPFAVRYAGGVAVLRFSLLYTCLLHYGFYNFCLSIPLFFCCIGWWRSPAARPPAPLALILILLYGCHVVSWGLALVALALFRPRAIGRLALAALPSAALA